MSAQCQNCGGKSQVFLCSRCITTLQTALADLPWWLSRLTESAIGQVRMGDGGRPSQRREPFKGDDEALAKCKCGHPEHEDRACEAVDREVIGQEAIDGMEGLTRPVVAEHPCVCVNYRPAADQATMRVQLLAAGRVNARAADLYDEIRTTLSTWVRDVCETHGIEAPALRTATGTARWLTERVSAIAAGEGAAECLRDVQTAIERTERMANRPVRRVWLGDCPHYHDRTEQTCGVSLWAPEDAIEVRCHRCRTVHDPQRLKLLLFNDLERAKVPWERILKANKSQPEDRQVPERTLQSWRKPGKNGDPPRLKIRGYRRPNGRIVNNRHSDEDVPLFMWPDVRKLREEKPQKKPTGSAAHRRVAG